MAISQIPILITARVQNFARNKSCNELFNSNLKKELTLVLSWDCQLENHDTEHI